MLLRYFAIFAGLTLIASIAPLLTSLQLWQKKEWRWDRLREHLRAHGWFRQLFGSVRPVTVIVLVILDQFGVFRGISFEFLPLFALCILNAFQVVLKKQPCPTWTAKAILMAATTFLWIFGTTAVLYALAIYSRFFFATYFLPVVALLAPLFLALTWVALSPLDRLLKRRILRKAIALRKAFPALTVIGIAGSVGKTTTKEILAHLLQGRGVLSTPEHVNSELGVAQWWLRQSDLLHSGSVHVVLVEMGAYRLGEIRTLCEVMQPTIGVLTAIGSDHLGLFGSEDAICRSNAELLAALPQTGHVFINAINPACRTLVADARCRVTLVGDHGVSLFETEKGIGINLHGTVFHLPFTGLHQAQNALLAMHVAMFLKIPEPRIQELLHSAAPLAHTFSMKTEHGVTVLDDTWNSSPLSVRAALEWSGRRRERPRVLLLAPLLELGHEDKRILSELGAFARGRVERLVCTHPEQRAILQEGFQQPVEFLDRSAAPVPPGSLLLCVGRMPIASLKRMLPAV
jgi:UDP-N-acetylmuramoyl-tripeptide--D-alanyl-D-alanine ligase